VSVQFGFRAQLINLLDSVRSLFYVTSTFYHFSQMFIQARTQPLEFDAVYTIREPTGSNKDFVRINAPARCLP
jgi:hypothetical protein